MSSSSIEPPINKTKTKFYEDEIENNVNELNKINDQILFGQNNLTDSLNLMRSNSIEIQKYINVLKNNNVILKNKNDSLQFELDKIRNEYDNLLNLYNKLKINNENLNKNSLLIKEENNKWVNERIRFDERIKLLEIENEKMKQKILDLNSDKILAENDNKSNKLNISDLNSKNLLLSNQIIDLKVALNECEKTRDFHINKLKEETKKNFDLQKKFNEINNENKNLKENTKEKNDKNKLSNDDFRRLNILLENSQNNQKYNEIIKQREMIINSS